MIVWSIHAQDVFSAALNVVRTNADLFVVQGAHNLCIVLPSPDKSLFNLFATILIEGPFDVNRLRKCLRRNVFKGY